MTDTTISGAVVFPQDVGSGVPEDEEDYSSAGFFSLLSKYKGEGSYVGEDTSGNPTLQFNDVDTSNEQVDVSTGYAYIMDSMSVQSGFQTVYDVALPNESPYVVILPDEVVNLDLGTDNVNDIWLAVDPTSNDSVYIRHGNGLTAPSDPNVKLGTVDTSSGDTTRTNDGAPSGAFRDEDGDDIYTLPNDTDGIDVGSVSTEFQDITDENVIVASGPSANRTTYNIDDHADVGAAVQQAHDDGHTAIKGPTNDQSFSTPVEVTTPFWTWDLPPSTELLYNDGGSGDSAITINSARACEINGGHWEYDGDTGGSADADGIEIRTDTGTAPRNKIRPNVVRDFHDGIVLRTSGSFIGYTRIEWDRLYTNLNAIANRAENGAINTSWYRGGAIDGQSVGVNGILFDGASDTMSGHTVFGVSMENLDNSFNIEGSNAVSGITVWGMYEELVTNRVNGNSEEIYIDTHRSKHDGREVYTGGRNNSGLIHSKSPSDPDVDIDRTLDDPAGVAVVVDGTKKRVIRDDGNLSHNQDESSGWVARAKSLTVSNGGSETLAIADASAQSSSFQGVVEILGNTSNSTESMYRKERFAFHDSEDTLDTSVLNSDGNQGTSTGIALTGSPGNIELTVENALSAFGRFTVRVRTSHGELNDF